MPWLPARPRGIGAAIADALGRAGATVIGTATSPEGAAAITERFATHGIVGRGLVLDVADVESIAAIQKEIAGAEGAVTLLVNNAGITRDNLLMRMKDEEWEDILRTNLSSVSTPAALSCAACSRRDEAVS